jgi:anti-anti-sigma regulatory factor
MLGDRRQRGVHKVLKEELVSECHDVYDPVESSPPILLDPVGAQCHDSYLAVPANVASSHECCLLSGLHGAVRVVRVVGRLDWKTDIRFRDLLRDECPERSVIVDLLNASLDAAGTGVVLSATARARKRGQQMVFVIADPVELEVLASQGLGFVVPVVASVSEALNWLGADRSAAEAPPVKAAT